MAPEMGQWRNLTEWLRPLPTVDDSYLHPFQDKRPVHETSLF